ncbi:electron transfer flavoprotein beta subunit lysine methyltransferase [Polypterus senegalus]|nr:electron transfer flavoprotein beta subunit lysine methyltransferase [Polypterus senegalus]
MLTLTQGFLRFKPTFPGVMPIRFAQHTRFLVLAKYHTVECFSAESDIRKFIVENTEVVQGNHLTPEIKMRLFTPKCRFWRARPELWPFSDPYWAIYWPGGQALTRFLLDNPGTSRGKKVLDLGSGCGASAMAASLSGASHVLANDIDPVATTAIKMNCELNNLKPLSVSVENLIGTKSEDWDLILLGDMFYDTKLSDGLHSWLKQCVSTHRTQVLIGDPGRANFENHKIQKWLCELAHYELPLCVTEENYGLTSSKVWEFLP